MANSFDNLTRTEKKDALAAYSLQFWLKRIVGFLLVLLVSLAAGCPQYKVWEQGLAGQAELRRAEQNRQIRIEEAQAELESAGLLAQAEAERARGVAEANKIIGEGLKGNEEYLRYLWITGLEDNEGVVYIPTEAGIPILEAGRNAQ